MLIRASHYSFTISAPYTSGHCITEVEAQVLNMARGRNIAKIIRRWLEGTSILLQGADLDALDSRVQALDARYSFSEPIFSDSHGALKDEISIVAREKAEEHFRSHGHALDGDAREVSIRRFARDWTEDPLVIEEARRRIQARTEVAIGGLEELL